MISRRWGRVSFAHRSRASARAFSSTRRSGSALARYQGLTGTPPQGFAARLGTEAEHERLALRRGKP
jgi:hypothetical protein